MNKTCKFDPDFTVTLSIIIQFDKRTFSSILHFDPMVQLEIVVLSETIVSSPIKVSTI